MWKLFPQKLTIDLLKLIPGLMFEFDCTKIRANESNLMFLYTHMHMHTTHTTHTCTQPTRTHPTRTHPQPFTLGSQKLDLPQRTKQFLISPPASPPVGWEQSGEQSPCVDFALVTALASLQLPGILLAACSSFHCLLIVEMNTLWASNLSYSQELISTTKKYSIVLHKTPCMTGLKVTGSLRADTRTVYLIKRYFIVFLSPKRKPCDPTWTWKTVLK